MNAFYIVIVLFPKSARKDSDFRGQTNIFSKI